jgi:hypothetical protein
MSYAVQFTLKSRNAKVGAMPVSTTSNVTCPDACPLKGSGCYAEAGPLGMLWRALSGTTAGQSFVHGGNAIQSLSWEGFTQSIAALPDGTVWRHNQAGDLPGIGDAIDATALRDLVEANKGKRGFTYSHKPVIGPDSIANNAAIQSANYHGFTVNLSANTMTEADTLAALDIGPVVTVLPVDQGRKAKGDTWLETEEEYRARVNVVQQTPQGRTVSICPATYKDNVSCQSCQLCQRKERKTIVAFPAHGTSKNKASAIAAS